MIELELVGVRIELPHNQPLVLLKERTGERFLPIWIGENEAKAIAHALQGYVPPRPLTMTCSVTWSTPWTHRLTGSS